MTNNIELNQWNYMIQISKTAYGILKQSFQDHSFAYFQTNTML